MSGSHLSKDFFELMCVALCSARVCSMPPRTATPRRLRHSHCHSDRNLSSARLSFCRALLDVRSKNIGECKSKQEEDKILAQEVATLKSRFSEQLTGKKMKEALVRVMYAEMLGHDASFGHIHAVNMTQQTALPAKRVGYLASAVCLHPGHELTTLVVNTLRRDVASSNHVEVCAALIAIPKLVSVEMMPALLQPVLALLDHSLETVRKKAVMVLHKFYLLQPESMAGHTDKLRRALCDKTRP